MEGQAKKESCSGIHLHEKAERGSCVKTHFSKRTQGVSRKSINSWKSESQASGSNFRHRRKNHMLRNRFLRIDAFTAYFREIILRKIDS